MSWFSGMCRVLKVVRAGSPLLFLVAVLMARKRCRRKKSLGNAVSIEALLLAAAQVARASRSQHADPEGLDLEVACAHCNTQQLATRCKLQRRVHLAPTISCVQVKNLRMLEPERKAELWWQQSDFEHFLQVRLEIGQAYREAARKLGVSVVQVSSLGSHGDAGYKAMIEAFPSLAEESRRGLGLGRQRERAKNRDAYIAAVLKEQRRQHEALTEEEHAESRQQQHHTLDWESMAALADHVSRKDRSYAVVLAQQYYEQDKALYESSIGEEEMPHRPEEPLVRKLRNSKTVGDIPTGILGQYLFADNVALTHEPTVLEERSSPSSVTSGFGLSRDRLQEVGLSATGHALSQYQRLRTWPGTDVHASFRGTDNGEASDVSDGCVEADATWPERGHARRLTC